MRPRWRLTPIESMKASARRAFSATGASSAATEYVKIPRKRMASRGDMTIPSLKGPSRNASDLAAVSSRSTLGDRLGVRVEPFGLRHVQRVAGRLLEPGRVVLDVAARLE